MGLARCKYITFEVLMTIRQKKDVMVIMIVFVTYSNLKLNQRFDIKQNIYACTLKYFYVTQ